MSEKHEKSWLPPLILCAVAIVMGFLICSTYLLTKTNIDTQAAAARAAARTAVLPTAASMTELPLEENATVDYCYAGFDTAGNPVGYVSQVTVIGFGGEIEVTVGMDMDCTITAISVGGSNFSETSGLGAKTKEEAFTSQFAGKSGLLVLKSNIDSVTGASVSSGAVVSGVNQALIYMSSLIDGGSESTEELPLTAEELAILQPGAASAVFAGGGTDIDGWWTTDVGYVVQATSFGRGPIVVKMGFDKNGTSIGIVIGDDNFVESEGYGARILESEYKEQFIGISGAVSYGNGIDAISGATSTSNAALTAINACLSFVPGETENDASVSGEASGISEGVSTVSSEVTSVPVPTSSVVASAPQASAETKAATTAKQIPEVPAASVPNTDAVSEASVVEEVKVNPTPTPAPTAAPIPTAAPVTDAVSEASITEEATPAPSPTLAPTPTPDAVSEASVTE